MATRRDIQQAAPQAPNALSTSGFGFATGASRYDPTIPDIQTSDFSFMKDVAPGLTKIVEGVMGTARENAFKQGQVDQASDMLNMGNTVDSASALIENASWLTKDAYTQGVRLQEFTEGQLEVQAAIQAQIKRSADANESLGIFSQKVKPILAKMNTKVAHAGLQGKAKDAAFDQILGYTVAAQKSYQETMEAKAANTFNLALNQNSAFHLDGFTNSSTPEDAVTQIDGLYNSTRMAAESRDPSTATNVTGKQLAAFIDQFSTRAVETSPADMMRVNSALAWLYNSPNAKNLPLDIREKMQVSLSAAQSRVHEFNYNQALLQIQNAETAFKTTGTFDPDFVTRGYTYVANGELDQTISLKHARSLREQLSKFYVSADSDAYKNYVSINGTGADIDAAGVTRSKASRERLQAILARNNGQPSGYIEGINEGVTQGIPELITLSAKNASGLFTSTLGMRTEELENLSTGGLADDMFTQLGDKYKELNSQGQFSMAEKLLAGIADTDQREAVRILWSDSGPTPSLGTELSMRYESLYTGLKSSTSEAYNQTFTLDALDDGFLGKTTYALSADFNYNQSDAMKQWQIEDLQEKYNLAVRPYLQANRIRFSKDETGESAIRTMMQHGFVIDTKTQMLAITPEQRQAIGGGVAASDDRIRTGLDGIANDVIVSLGDVEPHLKAGSFALSKNKVDRENVHFKLTNNGVIVGVMDDNGKSIGDYRMYSYGDVFKLSTPAAGAVVNWSGGISTAGVSDFKVVKDNGTFGSNNLKQGILRHLFVQEGYNKNLRPTDPNRPEVVTFGHGITPGAAMTVFGNDEAKVQRFVSLAQDPSSPEYQQMYDEFLNGYFKSFKTVVQQAGLPPPDITPMSGLPEVGNATRYQEAYKAIADAMYHGGVTGGGDAIARILQLAKTDKNAAVAELEKQKFYIQTGKDSGRKEFLINAVRSIPSN